MKTVSNGINMNTGKGNALSTLTSLQPVTYDSLRSDRLGLVLPQFRESVTVFNRDN